MSHETFLLPTLLLVPFIGALIGAFITNGSHARHWGLMVSTITFAVSVAVGVEI